MNNDKFLIIAICAFLFGFAACISINDNPAQNENEELPWTYDGISELRRGDILVKANSNIFPATAYVEKGWNAGHAVIVLNGTENDNTDSLLFNTLIFESHSRPLPREFQLREVRALDLSKNPFINNDSFSSRYKGSRYRLRLNLNESQIDSIIDFIVNQKGSYSSWNAMKRFPDNADVLKMISDGNRINWADNTHWYCSLLIWQAVFYVTGIDLDVNKGYFVYPNDLIMSTYFDNTENFIGRARF
jgi:hypothetical protein